MYYTTNKATSLYNLTNPDVSDATTILSSAVIPLSQGQELQSASDPPKAALFGFLQVIGSVNGKGVSGYVAEADLTQETLSKTQKLGVGIAAVVLGWLFFFKKH